MKWRVLLLLAFLLATPHLLLAQEALDEVESLMARGLIFGARDRLAEWWEEGRAGAGRTEIQRGIWLRGILTVDPSLAALDFQRLALEFPGGPYTDDALYRMAQEAELRGDLRAAAQRYRILARDYPASSLQPLASVWLERHPDVLEALTPPERGEGNVLGPPPSAHPPEAGPRTGSISIQLGAFRNLDGARRLLSDLGAEGYEARLVRVGGSPLIRVRVGRFHTREEVRDLRLELSRRGWESTVVFDVREEERVGDQPSTWTP